MTVAELFATASLSIGGGVRWRLPVPANESKGVYVVARSENPNANAARCSLPLRPPPANLCIDLDYERQRWQENESVVYIGKTDQPLARRLEQFYGHVCGKKSPHAGGQILLLLDCDLWVYWSPSDTPRDHEKAMLSEFKQLAGEVPFANFDGKRRPRRVQLL